MKKLTYFSKLPENTGVEFTVSYIDRFLGLLDTNLEHFIESDIPHHRVGLFKRDSVIIWDKKKRYTTI